VLSGGRSTCAPTGRTGYQPGGLPRGARRVDQPTVIRDPRHTVRGSLTALFFAACTLLPGCTARYILGPSNLQSARDSGAFNQLGVYVSHRTIAVWERDEGASKRVGREIDDRSMEGRLRQPIGRNDAGLIVGEDLRNGAWRLWISFDPGCGTVECAYGFVQTEDGRFRLVDLPEREAYDTKTVYRSLLMDRHEMKQGKLRALSDANAVFRLERKNKKRPKTVFLEVKIKRRKRTNERVDAARGN